MVHIDDVLALLEVGVRRGVLHVLDGLLFGHDLRQGEERGLEDGVVALAHADLDGKVDGVDGVELDVVLGDVALGIRLEVMVQLIEIPLAVDHEHAAGLDVVDHLEALDDVAGVVAGDEVGLVDVVGAADGLSPKRRWEIVTPPVFLGVILEVAWTYLSVWSPMILMEFLFAPTVPSPPRPQNLHSMVPSAAVFGQFLSSGRERFVTSSTMPMVN